MEIKILKEIGFMRNKNHRKYIYCQTEYGIIKCDDVQLRKGHKKTINSAVNKISFLENFVRKKYNKNIRILSKSFKDGNSKILISINGIEYYTFVTNLQKALPNILSCLNKDKLTINKLNIKHNYHYEYPNFEYEKSNSIINIICPHHGLFKQNLSSHMKGSGCSLCGHIRSAEGRLTYTKGMENAIVYCIKLKESNGNIFYKIGFTRHSVEYRFKNKYENQGRMPYDYEIIFEKVLKYEDALIEESRIHKELSHLHYKPMVKFDGSATECFTNYKLIK